MSNDSVPDGDFPEDLVENPRWTTDELKRAGEERLARYTGIRNMAAFIANLIVTYDDTVSCHTGKPWYEIAQEALDAHREGR